MSKLDQLGTASNERRTQNIMKLRNNFNHEKYNSITDAVQDTGYSYKTVVSWATEGNIPLLDENDRPIVPPTPQNARAINAQRRTQSINRLCELFYDQHATTVSACATQLHYPAETIIRWAQLGDVPLITAAGTPVVPLSETNTPVWFDES